MSGLRVLADDYRALREGVGAYALPRDVVWVHGPDAVQYLQGQCSQEVVGLAPGAAADALLLAPDGKLDALVRLVRTGDDGVLLDTEAGYAEVVLARLRRFRLRSKVDLDLLAWSCLALRGRGVAGAPGGAALPVDDGPVPPGPVPVDWHGWAGVDLLGPAPEPPSGARRCGPDAWEACRIESGVPVMGRELDQRTIAAEADLVDRAVSFTKGCFTGQELVARLDARGSRVARRLCGVAVDVGPAEAPGLVGAALRDPAGTDGPERGRITSAAWSPAHGAAVALAYAHRSLAVPGPVALAGPDGSSLGPAELRPLPLR